MKAKTLTSAGIAVIAILLITTAVAFVSNSRNKRNFNSEKIQNESLTSQKLQASNELDKAKSDLAAITSKEETTGKDLTEAKSKLMETENRISHLSKENGSLMKDRDELVQLQKSKMELDKAYSDLKMEQETALSHIKNLENSEIALDADKNELISKLENADKYRTDNIEIFGSTGKRKDKPTNIARRTKELNIDFYSPLNKSDEISYKIVTPSGTVINPEDKSTAWVVLDHSPQKMTASLSTASVEPENSRKIELRDNARGKLEPGIYKIMIFSNDNIIGSYRLRLK